MKKKAGIALLIAMFLGTTTSLASDTVTRPDDIKCRDNTPPKGWYKKSNLDFSGEAGVMDYIYFLYKYYISPRMESDCQTEEFFEQQDLSFGHAPSRAAASRQVASIAAVGDLMVRDHLDQANSRHLYDDIAVELFGADIVFGNLETPVVPDKPTKPFPAFNLSGEAARVYLGAGRPRGFDIVSTANNHVIDQGMEGLLATLDFLDNLGVAHVGSSRGPEQRDREFPVIEAGGIKVAFLAYTFSTNGRDLPAGREYAANLVRLNSIHEEPDLSLIRRHISMARERGADIVVVSVHCGNDYEFYPVRRLIDRYHRIIDTGADIILAHHPHVLGPLERYVPPPREAGVPEALIAYSLGNFIPDTDSKKVPYTTGMILHVSVARALVDGKPRVWIDQVGYTPTWFYCRTMRGSRDYRLINLDKAASSFTRSLEYTFLSNQDWIKLFQAEQLVSSKYPMLSLVH